jgi:hypothetical protein
MVQSLIRRGHESLISSGAVGIYNFANDHPLDWGAGGPKAWPGVRPYAEPAGGQDHRGFRLFEWYRSILDQVLGVSVPFIVCANGPQRPTGGGLSLSESLHAERAAEMARMMTDGALPTTVLNHAFWLLSAERGDTNHDHAWFLPDGTPRLPAARAFLKLAKSPRANLSPTEPAPAIWSPTAPTATVVSHSGPSIKDAKKPIDHYLLLPLFEWGAARWHLAIIQEYVEAFLPTVGFSVEEAKLAQRVTVIGNSQGTSVEAVCELEAAGCQVQRIAGQNGAETQTLLRQLAQNKQHSR